MVARQFLFDRLNSVFLQVSSVMVFLLQALCQHLNRLNFLRRHRLLTILLGQSAFEFFFRLALPLRLKFCDGCTGLRSCWFPEICWTLANLAHNSLVDKLVMLHVSSYLVIFLTKIKTLVERGVKDLLSRIFQEGRHCPWYLWFSSIEIGQLNHTCWRLVSRCFTLRATTTRSATTFQKPLFALDLRFLLRGWRTFLNARQFFAFNNFCRTYLFLNSIRIRINATLSTSPNWQSLTGKALLRRLH